MGSILFIAFIFVVINILVDVLYVWIDPRVKFS
jgi:peptide/nickel transport system permease protein